MSDDQPTIRTRFAPSPTGFLHVGAARTALFAWLVARQAGGQFILRIEDTDKEREVSGSTQHIIDSLHWLGINWDEGVDIGGEHAPYLQSERLEIYTKWAHKLIEQGRAYADPYSKDELDTFREAAKASKKPFLYRNHRPENPPEWDGSQPLRFRSQPKSYAWSDAIMSDLKSGEESIDDFIIIKSDGYPTYNFCHIIDDMLMGVTHILRSQEFLSSVPKFLNLYEALGIQPPVLATLPFVMAIDGKKKLSKRDGAKDLLDYAREGFLPEALMNFLATLGWNDGTKQEIFTPQEIIEKFSLNRVQKSPARFDEQRLIWLNGQHIRRLDIDTLYDRVQNFWPESATNASDTQKHRVLTLVQDRLKTLADITALTSYFFEEPTPDISLIESNKQFSKIPPTEQAGLLHAAVESLSQLENWQSESIQAALNNLLESTDQKPGILFSIIRIATTWASFSPALSDTIEILGKATSVSRLQKAADLLDK